MTNTTWTYEYSAYTTSDGKEIPAFEIFDSEGVKIADTNEDTPAEQQEANARLIAAAPELLEVLEILANEAEARAAPPKQFIDKARAAIARARGGGNDPQTHHIRGIRGQARQTTNARRAMRGRKAHTERRRARTRRTG